MTELDDVRRFAAPLRSAADLDPLVERARKVDFVLLGEASHGTHEYYRWRAELTKRLIEDGQVRFVAVEGDWPDCHRVHRCVTLQPGAPTDPLEVLHGFARWPTWMWANEEVVEFCRWLRDWNAERPPAERVGFHGLDVYSLWDSLRAVMAYLAEHEPQHLATARRAWTCFEPYREDPQSYARSLRLVPTSCEQEVVTLLRRLCEQRPQPDGIEPESRFVAEQNAAVAAGAERYYRTLVTGGISAWNVRDCHMLDTLDRLVAHYGAGRAVVWEHNTHIGDARATDMAQYGEVNVGQLVRERHGRDRVLAVGFAGHRGTVVAADQWDAPTRVLPLPPAREGSLEDLLMAAVPEPALLDFPGQDVQPAWLRERRGHRAASVRSASSTPPTGRVGATTSRPSSATATTPCCGSRRPARCARCTPVHTTARRRPGRQANDGRTTTSSGAVEGRGADMNAAVRSVMRGAAAGAVGTTALNALTYLDMAVRGRPASRTPEDTVESVSEDTHVPIPGEDETRTNRVAGARAADWPPVRRRARRAHRFGPGCRVASRVARRRRGHHRRGLARHERAMTALGGADPRTWSLPSWLVDVVPHIGYGAVTAAVLERLDPE